MQGSIIKEERRQICCEDERQAWYPVKSILKFHVYKLLKKLEITFLNYTGCPKKNARSWHFGYNSTLEMARNKGRVCFEKFRKFSI